jgi:hypothetical protein
MMAERAMHLKKYDLGDPVLGEEVIRATSSSKDVKEVATSVSLWSSSKDVTCPDQKLDQ